ncbi:MAG: hypothetical protein E7256_17200 [Lachnospiraceae bacterium]|nr:hypothetical protein [Lachnospiraceae bacterium]
MEFIIQIGLCFFIGSWLKGGMETRNVVSEGDVQNISEYEKIKDIPKMDHFLSQCGAKYILKCLEKEKQK